jgi:hypothetical protein
LEDKIIARTLAQATFGGGVCAIETQTNLIKVQALRVYYFYNCVYDFCIGGAHERGRLNTFSGTLSGKFERKFADRFFARDTA